MYIHIFFAVLVFENRYQTIRWLSIYLYTFFHCKCAELKVNIRNEGITNKSNQSYLQSRPLYFKNSISFEKSR